MEQLFHYDSPFVSFVNKIIDMVLLNLLFLIGSIPLVTIGAAQTALCISLRRHFSSDAPIFSTFWKAYLVNIKQSTILWILSLCVHVLGIGGILYYVQTNASPFLFVLQIVLYLLCLATESWLFPLHAFFPIPWDFDKAECLGAPQLALALDISDDEHAADISTIEYSA